MTVYVIDDHPLMRDALTMLLHRVKPGLKIIPIHKLNVVESTVEKNGPPELFCLDLQLPDTLGMSGVQVLKAKFPDIPLVVVTSSSASEYEARCLEAGADAFIAKPTHPGELLAIINAHARRHTAAPIESDHDSTGGMPAAKLDLRRMMLCGPLAEIGINGAAAMILSALALAPGKRLEHWQLIEVLREDAQTYTTAALAVRIVRLRHLLRAAGFEGPTVRAMRSEGYQLCVQVTVA